MVEREDTATSGTDAVANAFGVSRGRALLDRILMVFLGLWIVGTAGYYFLWFSLTFYEANRGAIGSAIGKFQL